MLIRQAADVRASEVTPRRWYESRREFLRRAAALGLAGNAFPAPEVPAQHAAAPKLPGAKSPFSTSERLTPYKDVTGYNNFYEFGTDKHHPAQSAQRMKTRPWTVAVDGEVRRKGIFDIDDLLRLAPMEERIYRLRCVEGWSMVIPWVGYPLAALIGRVEPTGRAKYVAFVTHMDAASMHGLRRPVLDWPYVEALRLDEAVHPLTLLCFGLYGEVLPNQNGAPLRVVVPWKYGFKSGKSIVRFVFTEHQPRTSWTIAAAHEYGFYSNVNPAVDHPRWSQSSERRIGEDGFLQPKRKTLLFNGYAEQVAGLYAGMDLKKNF